MPFETSLSKKCLISSNSKNELTSVSGAERDATGGFMSVFYRYVCLKERNTVRRLLRGAGTGIPCC